MRIMVLDTEKNGRYGHTIAYAAYLYDENGVCSARSTGRVHDECIDNPWAWKHVRPAIADIEPVHTYAGAMEEAFWNFWCEHRIQTSLVTFCGAPFETQVIYRCVKRHVVSRQDKAPFPVHDLATLFFVLEGGAITLHEYAAKHKLSVPYKKSQHDPRYDAQLTYACWRHAVERFRA